jgi:hypothetical protein
VCYVVGPGLTCPHHVLSQLSLTHLHACAAPAAAVPLSQLPPATDAARSSLSPLLLRRLPADPDEPDEAEDEAEPAQAVESTDAARVRTPTSSNQCAVLHTSS